MDTNTIYVYFSISFSEEGLGLFSASEKEFRAYEEYTSQKYFFLELNNRILVKLKYFLDFCPKTYEVNGLKTFNETKLA